jgi:transcription-repair coupling factor (superfamily II helicase)
MEYTELLLFLRKNGYAEVDHIHKSGDFLVLGDTIICWPAGELAEYRIRFFGEELESVEQKMDEVWQQCQMPIFVPNQLSTDHGTIKPGEYIVHPFHGVGIFEGIIAQRTIDGVTGSFVALQYAGNDRLLFPVEKQKELMPYIGSRHPRLTRLYSKAWQHTKERVQKNLIHTARELLKIFAARQLKDRPNYVRATEWLEKLDQSVDFSLTDDQQRALNDIFRDFEASPHPMDRLVCGDVGFGKTEVALRAAAQVIANGKQVAFIAPTTILVEQHYTLLQERFASLPVNIAHLSRLTAGKDAPILEQIKEGTADLVVGTHRLLGTDVQFKDLGLLIVDEEQKFGVAQKERLKKLRPSVDVLSLSATPIPRTLSLSLSGLRGLSLLRTAPQGRLPIETEILPYLDADCQEALTKELARGGQIYVVHNRVQSLPVVLEHIKKLAEKAGFEDARIELAHGQLPEVTLAQRMSAFLKGEIDILVASSIVEHGLDSPRANTLIVLHSEWFGLSDLYQLRGRVGRRSKQAYAYFFTGGIERTFYDLTEEELPVSVTAKQRLAALKEADTLGSGWSIALRDLEIRGGGNILGHEQHGSMEAIGLLLYAQLLQEEIGRQAKILRIPLFQKTDELE